MKKNIKKEKELLDIVNEFLANTFNDEAYRINGFGGWATKFDIPVALLGAVAPMFDSLSVAITSHSGEMPITSGSADTEMVVRLFLKYRYEHSRGGENGYTVDYIVTSDYGVVSCDEFWKRRVNEVT